MSTPVRVLVVEDSEDDTKLAMRMLRLGGFEPTWKRVQDVEALKQALLNESWDAVLSDYRLPGFNGVAVLEIFRATGLDIPFVFFSGTIGEETAVAAMKGGASDCVMKQNLTRLAPVFERELAQAAMRAAHRRTRAELDISRDRYMDLYDFAPVGYLTLSTDGLIVQANLTGADLLGVEREPLLSMRFDRFVAPADAARWNELFQHTLLHGGKHRVELGLRSGVVGTDPGGAGTEIDAPRSEPKAGLHVQLDCLRVDAQSTAPRVRVSLTDISDRREAEADLRRFEARLQEVQKMQSVGTLAGGIAHDFNNILGAILGNVTLARGDVGADHPALTSLDEIYKSSVRARNLVQQILTFSRREPQQLLKLALQPVIEETHKLLYATLPASVELVVTMTAQPLHVLADANQIQQVLMNLCTNAWQALSATGGRIEVGLDVVDINPAQSRRLGDVAAGACAHLWVSDNGVGMDAATQVRIFEPFFTTKPVGQGTGLGLSVVHGIVSAHHGAISVDSTPGQGCRFNLYFPRVEPDPIPAAPPALLATGALPATGEVPMPVELPGRGEHVLYVDDDATMVIVASRLLERAGYRVSAHADARAAVAAVRAQPGDFDIVVTDYNMPEFSGLDVAREMALIRPDLPVVICSGFITDELREQARLAGVRCVLEKQNIFEALSGLVALTLTRDAHPGQ